VRLVFGRLTETVVEVAVPDPGEKEP